MSIFISSPFHRGYVQRGGFAPQAPNFSAPLPPILGMAFEYINIIFQVATYTFLWPQVNSVAPHRVSYIIPCPICSCTTVEKNILYIGRLLWETLFLQTEIYAYKVIIPGVVVHPQLPLIIYCMNIFQGFRSGYGTFYYQDGRNRKIEIKQISLSLFLSPSIYIYTVCFFSLS